MKTAIKPLHRSTQPIRDIFNSCTFVLKAKLWAEDFFFPFFCLLCIISLWFFFKNYSYYFHFIRSSFCPLTLITVDCTWGKTTTTTTTQLSVRNSIQRISTSTLARWSTFRGGHSMIDRVSERGWQRFSRLGEGRQINLLHRTSLPLWLRASHVRSVRLSIPSWADQSESLGLNCFFVITQRQIG